MVRIFLGQRNEHIRSQRPARAREGSLFKFASVADTTPNPAGLFDYFVRAHENRVGDFHAKCFRRFHIDDQFELGRLFHR